MRYLGSVEWRKATYPDRELLPAHSTRNSHHPCRNLDKDLKLGSTLSISAGTYCRIFVKGLNYCSTRCLRWRGRICKEQQHPAYQTCLWKCCLGSCHLVLSAISPLCARIDCLSKLQVTYQLLSQIFVPTHDRHVPVLYHNIDITHTIMIYRSLLSIGILKHIQIILPNRFDKTWLQNVAQRGR